MAAVPWLKSAKIEVHQENAPVLPPLIYVKVKKLLALRLGSAAL
jgi:hypothetical protein